jgi:hypothetical protein
MKKLFIAQPPTTIDTVLQLFDGAESVPCIQYMELESGSYAGFYYKKK